MELSIATNDNWRSDQEPEIMATGIPPTDDAEVDDSHDPYAGCVYGHRARQEITWSVSP